VCGIVSSMHDDTRVLSLCHDIYAVTLAMPPRCGAALHITF
jgi:hypothetical protein